MVNERVLNKIDKLIVENETIDEIIQAAKAAGKEGSEIWEMIKNVAADHNSSDTGPKDYTLGLKPTTPIPTEK